ncbi:transcriptional regulator, Sir2 family protein [Tritrichomonas foetus]|uniref:NAD-dependent protein deacetylase n=1 Tax=Tritrichomonas foetus TaxID=1144522 RepID=A0A1J4KJ90_9EUKA|nr:transcriptional regulator, Sir2 family protein [Tritrichomonas foetus]|eukprot:OHT09892.1 transcriptional regulator, Sir2 family protein [Tritrichomonas foetus]
MTEDRKLKSFDIEGIADYIKNGKAKKIVLMTGAGISVGAGIPDFRSIGTGLYSQLEKYHLPNPTDVFTLSYFDEHPEPFFDLVGSLLPGNSKPTAVHYFGKLLDQKGLLLRQFTQNIDGLERTAGIPPDHIVESHGTFFTAHCRKCNHEYELEDIRADLQTGKVLHCKEEGCDGIVKPDVVFFQENLPNRFRECARTDLGAADLLIIIGTSLKVYPFAGLTAMVKDDVPRVLINNDKVAQYSEEVEVIDGVEYKVQPKNFRALLRYDHATNSRDVYLGGDCQETIKQLAELLGWKDELDALIKSA